MLNTQPTSGDFKGPPLDHPLEDDLTVGTDWFLLACGTGFDLVWLDLSYWLDLDLVGAFTEALQ